MSLKKIIALYASSDAGKTTTLNILIDILRIVSDSYTISKEYDAYATFEFNNETICVCTGGDSKDVITNNINYFKSEKCTIAVSATRTKGDGKELYDNFATQQKLKVIKVHKDEEPDTSRLYAAKLFQIITEKIDIEVENLENE
ncbi:MAG: hypothetical protein U0K92_07455 [Treponema sp.]|nr:hypothetical protein [Treponema sp.]